MWEVRSDHTQFNPIYSRSSTSLRQFVDVTGLLLERKTFTSAELVIGRTLIDHSMLRLRNYKKAGSIVGKYLDDNGSPKFSGWDMTKVWTKVLDDMWDMLMSKKNEETKSPDEVAQQQSSRERALFSSEEEDDDITTTNHVSRPLFLLVKPSNLACSFDSSFAMVAHIATIFKLSKLLTPLRWLRRYW